MGKKKTEEEINIAAALEKVRGEINALATVVRGYVAEQKRTNERYEKWFDEIWARLRRVEQKWQWFMGLMAGASFLAVLVKVIMRFA